MEPVKLHYLIPVLNPAQSHHPPLNPIQQEVLRYIDGYTSLAALPTLTERSLEEITEILRELISFGLVQLYQRPLPASQKPTTSPMGLIKQATQSEVAQTSQPRAPQTSYSQMPQTKQPRASQTSYSQMPQTSQPRAPQTSYSQIPQTSQPRTSQTSYSQMPQTRQPRTSQASYSQMPQEVGHMPTHSLSQSSSFAHSSGAGSDNSMPWECQTQPSPQPKKTTRWRLDWGEPQTEQGQYLGYSEAELPFATSETSQKTGNRQVFSQDVSSQPSWSHGQDSTKRWPAQPASQYAESPVSVAVETPSLQQPRTWGNGQDSTMRFPRQQSNSTPGTLEWHPKQAQQYSLQSRIERDRKSDIRDPSPNHSPNRLVQVSSDRTQVSPEWTQSSPERTRFSPHQPPIDDENTLIVRENHALQMGPPQNYPDIRQNIGNPFEETQVVRRSHGDEDTMREPRPPKISRIQQRYRERLSQSYTSMRQQGSQTHLPASPAAKKH